MNQQQNDASNEIRTEDNTTRRRFGKAALWVAPALTVMLAANAQPAKANTAYPNGNPG